MNEMKSAVNLVIFYLDWGHGWLCYLARLIYSLPLLWLHPDIKIMYAPLPMKDWWIWALSPLLQGLLSWLKQVSVCLLCTVRDALSQFINVLCCVVEWRGGSGVSLLKRLLSSYLLLWIHVERTRLVCLAVSGQVSPGVVVCSLIFFLNTCGISSPTRVISRGTLLSYTGGIVTLPCPVTTRSSVPGSTARATSLGYRSPPPHQLWCQRDGKAKSVPELQAPPLNQSPSTVISHLPPQL